MRKTSKIICLVIGLLVMFLARFIPIANVSSETVQMLSIFVGSIFLWITVPIEIGSLACLTALLLLPGVTPASVFNASFGNTTVWFLVFSCILTFALSSTGVLRRIALYFINNNFARKSVYSFLGLYLLSILVLGSFMAPTTVFILFFGLVKEIFTLMDLKKGDKLATRMMVGTAFMASISCAFTPIAHTFSLMAFGFYNTSTGNIISYAEYLKYSLPIGLILAICAFLLLCIKLPKKYKFNNVKFKNTKWNTKEIISVIVFLIVVILWVITGIWPKVFVRLNSLGTTFIALVGVLVLAVIGILDVKEGFIKGVPWSAILLCAATLALGTFLKSDNYGIIAYLSKIVGSDLSAKGVMWLIVIVSVVLTNLISNIVTTTVAYNIFVPALLVTGLVSPVTATIAIGIGASLAYALPSSIAHVALAGSSGYATNKDMLKYGSIMIVISILVMGVIL